MHLPHTTVVLADPPSLSAVHHVEDVKADAIELGELRLEDLLSVEVVEGKVVSAAGRACPAPLPSYGQLEMVLEAAAAGGSWASKFLYYII